MSDTDSDDDDYSKPKVAQMSQELIVLWHRMNMFAFHGHSVLTNKIKLCNLAKSSPALAEYIPTTFELPVDWIEMSKITKAQESNDMLWLSKPASMSRGNGIVLVKNADVCEHVDRARRTGRAFVMQRYLDAPLLIAGRKWDLRLYVAITSIEPLQAYIYHEGFARFCSKVYDRQAEDIAGHLTNSYVSARQNRTTALPEGTQAARSTMTLSELWPVLLAQGFNIDRIRANITRLLEVALESAAPSIAENSIRTHSNHSNLLGFDVMLEHDGQARLIEVNSAPDMVCYSPCQEPIKTKLMREYVELVFERPADSLLTEMGLKKANPRSDFPDPSLGDGKGLFVGEKKFKGGWMSLFQQEIIEEKYN